MFLQLSHFPIHKLFSQRYLSEFPTEVRGISLANTKTVRQLPFREFRGQKFAQLRRACLRTLIQHDHGKRALLPFRMRNADHSCFFYGGMPMSVFPGPPN